MSLVRRLASRSEHASAPVRGSNHESRVLWVGNQPQRMCLSHMLINSGMQVCAAACGTEAIMRYHEQSFSLVITDMALADMTGIELLTAIKSIDQDASVIVTTRYACLEEALEAIRAGAFDYIVNPAQAHEVILSAIRRAGRRIASLRKNRELIEKLQQKTGFLERANALLEDIAIHDSLTGLYNHRFFQDRLRCEINRCGRCSQCFGMLFIDLDNFKKYNDAHGHLRGDELLRTIARFFLMEFRKTDTVSRYGGDEFVVILPETSLEEGLKLSAKICRRVAESNFRGMDCMPAKKITISIGYAGFPYDGASSNDLLRQADRALYEAKAAGGGRVGYNSAHRPAAAAALMAG